MLMMYHMDNFVPNYTPIMRRKDKKGLFHLDGCRVLMTTYVIYVYLYNIYMTKGAKKGERDFVFFTQKMINEISNRREFKLYLESNKVALTRFAHVDHDDGSFFAGLDTHITNSSKMIHFKDILNPETILYQTCLKNINDGYIMNALDEVSKKAMDMPTHYDLLFITATAPREVTLDGGGKRIIGVGEKVGLLLIELGECKMFPNIPVIKLMCSLSVSPILMYTYLYIMKKMGLKKGLLELAGCYYNINGLCAYDRFGFVENYDLKNIECFGEEDLQTEYATSLPMEVNLDNIDYKDLDDVLHKRMRLGSEPLCDDVFRDNDDVRKKQRAIIDARQAGFDKIVRKLLKNKKGALVAKKGLKKTRVKKKALREKYGTRRRR